MSALDRLISLVPPYSYKDDRSIDWAAVESQLDSPLPSDYKRLVERYGAGVFDDFIWVYQPMYPTEALDIGWRNRNALETLRVIGADQIPYSIEAGAEELLVWGGTETREECYWVKSDADPERWTVVLNDAGDDEWFSFEGSMSEFLVAALSGECGRDFFVDFPSPRPIFSPDPLPVIDSTD
ncbi:SMI1/KNR4 family protein [Haloechinothrix halophila]|uniref:hypothetical protein n=1 Tax=Haloechinothrix halophila TaxID=1069073 RepID=UPI0012F7BD78|nr:hypothetical protein [Haloechinothrix halophila]